jgi:hypothetical protein
VVGSEDGVLKMTSKLGSTLAFQTTSKEQHARPDENIDGRLPSFAVAKRPQKEARPMEQGPRRMGATGAVMSLVREIGLKCAAPSMLRKN